jgi:hypothetical protein
VGGGGCGRCREPWLICVDVCWCVNVLMTVLLMCVGVTW